MNNINLVRKIATGVGKGVMPDGRVRVVEKVINGVTAYQFNYTDEAQRSKMTEVEEACRGLIISERGDILALPMPKFYNLGEPACVSIPDEPYTIWEKVDGSLGIFFHDGNRWQCNTRGSFDNEYTEVGIHYWHEYSGHFYGNPSITYMAEICIDGDSMPRAAYKPQGIYLIAARDRNTGVDIHPMTFDGLMPTANHIHGTIDDVLERRQVDEGVEGWVVRFNGGTRIKVKTDWYLRVFRAIHSLTPKNVRELMLEGNDWISDLPDDVQATALEMESEIAEMYCQELLGIYEAYSMVAYIPSRKEFAITVTRDYPAISSWLFKLRDNKFDEKDVLRRMEV